MRRLRPLTIPALLFAAACSPRIMALRASVPLLDKGADAFYEESDPALARDAFPAQLKLLEGMLQNDPGNRRLKRLLAEGFAAYSFLFLEDAEPVRAKGTYLRARGYGLETLPAALAELPSMPLDAVASALKNAGLDDVPGLFWAGYGWGGWINQSKDSPEAVADLPKVVAIMERVAAVSPGYYFSGAELFLATYDAARPRMLGGNPERAKARFEAAMKANGDRFLIAKVLCAQYYAVAIQDADLFKRLLNEVLESSAELPKARLANAVAKQKARRLMERTDELF